MNSLKHLNKALHTALYAVIWNCTLKTELVKENNNSLDMREVFPFQSISKNLNLFYKMDLDCFRRYNPSESRIYWTDLDNLGHSRDKNAIL